jgi:hypothetical protein
MILHSEDNYLVHLIGRANKVGVKSSISVAGCGLKEVTRVYPGPSNDYITIWRKHLKLVLYLTHSSLNKSQEIT